MDHATGARLRDAREERGLSPDEVAGAIGIPPEAVTDIEQGDALRHYGPGLAAAWTWAVGRHLGIAIDHELATWQPPTPEEPAAGHDPGPVGSEPGEGDQPDDAAARPGDDPSATSEANDAAFREPKITPGWLADYDHDPLESFDPSSTDYREPPGADDAGGEPAAPLSAWQPGGGDSGLASGPDAGAGGDELEEAALWRDPPQAREGGGPTAPQPTEPEPQGEDVGTQPDDDLWGPDPGTHGGPVTDGRVTDPGIPEGDDDLFATMSVRSAEAPPGESGAATPEADEAGPTDPDGPRPGSPSPPGVASEADEPEDTGELPSAPSDTRVLAYTEGEEAPSLTTPSRARTVGAVLAALVVLVGAGVGVGALAAQLLDTPADSPASSDEVGSADGDTADDARESADAPDDDAAGPGDEADEGPAGSGQSDEAASSEIEGDPSAAADAADTTVQILDGSDDDGRYADAQAVLDELGYQVITSGPAASEYDETTVFVTGGFADEAAALAEADERFTRLKPNDVGLSEDVELHVIVGGDWPDPDDG